MIVLFSGPAAVGKSTICAELESSHGFKPIKSSGYLRALADEKGLEVTRNILQKIGDQLDLETNFSWLVEDVAKLEVHSQADQKYWYVDSVRKPMQIEHFRKSFGEKIFHIHIDAREAILTKRFDERLSNKDTTDYEKPYDEHIKHPNEISSRALGGVADLVIEYSDISAGEAVQLILDRGAIS
jgi:adenylosuccinate synthase